MDKSENYQILEDHFASTFIRELMPGVLHNFANPLNGIMGRAKLLQRRIDVTVKKIEEKYPETAADLQEDLNRIKNDIGSINRESDIFFDLFRDASGKFYALASKGEERINLSQLMAAELRFANFYLEFKHEIRKNACFEENIPDIKGNPAEWSLIGWWWVRFAMSRALASEKKEFILETKHDANNVIVAMQYSGEAVTERAREIMVKYLSGDAVNPAELNLESGLLSTLQILKKNSARIEFGVESHLNRLAILIPYRMMKG